MANLLDLFGVCVHCHSLHYLSATQIRYILLVAVKRVRIRWENIRLLDWMFPENRRVTFAVRGG